MTQGTHRMDQLRERARLMDDGVGVYQLVKVRVWSGAILMLLYCYSIICL